jgi:threonine synthase
LRYISTRGGAPALGFADALLTGLARDGGLYVPDTWPALAPEDIRAVTGLPYWQAALRVLTPFCVPDVAEPDLARMTREAYAGFRHAAVAPLVQIGPRHFVLELFHGPTLAFKDVAMQWLARVMDHVLTRRRERVVIVGATSGDTGGAAIEAFRGLGAADVFILFPHGRVSEVQRRQMTTVGAPNVHAIAVEGTFDDCQAIVKGLFNDLAFRDHWGLSGVNSINWARLAAQTVYYVTAAAALGAPARPVAFSVPTGNFGDVFAGYAAARMGLDVARLIVATNVNDILARCLATGRYELRPVVPTQSPSMDIQVSSNFERLLFEAHHGDGAAVAALMHDLARDRAFSLAEPALASIRGLFAAHRADESETAETMRRVHAESGYLLDPHSAVGVAAAERELGSLDPAVPVVTLATAHPAKFPDAVAAATGVRPALPPHLADLFEREERFAVLPNDRAAVARLIEAHAGRERAVA